MYAPEPGSSEGAVRATGTKNSERQLRPGRILSLTISQRSDGRFSLRGSGVRLVVDALPAGRTGEVAQFKIVGTNPLLLQVLVPSRSPAGGAATPRTTDNQTSALLRFLQTFRLSNVPFAREVASALTNSGRRASPDVVRHIAALMADRVPGASVRESGGSRALSSARGLLELSDRSFDAREVGDRDLGGELLGFLGVSPVARRRRASEDRDGTDPDRSEHRRQELASYLRRSTASPSHPVQLFNAVRAATETHWVVIPIGAYRGDRYAAGVLRIGIRGATGKPVQASIELSRAGATWTAYWTIDESEVLLSAVEHPPGYPFAEETLARLGRTVHTGVRVVSGDGFDPMFDEGSGVDDYG